MYVILCKVTYIYMSSLLSLAYSARIAFVFTLINERGRKFSEASVNVYNIVFSDAFFKLLALSL